MGKTRGLLFYALGGEEMDVAVKKYRTRRDGRLIARGVRKDDEEENTNNKPGGEKTGGHGNTKLPFGLCKKYGIEYGEDWTPKDAWDALASKGVTPAGEYAKLSGKSVTLKRGKTEYRNVFAKKRDDKYGRYYLYGDFDSPVGGKSGVWEKAEITSFINKDELMAYLQEEGIKKFKDPDTGKTVNPQEMDLPKTVAKIGDKRYVDVILGVAPIPYGRAITVTGKDFSGYKQRLKMLKSPKAAERYLEEIGCKAEDARKSADYKKWFEKKKD